MPTRLNYKEKAMIDETGAVLRRVREQEDSHSDGCFNTKPEASKGAPDVYLQLNFLIESWSCTSSMMQPVPRQLRGPKASMRGLA